MRRPKGRRGSRGWRGSQGSRGQLDLSPLAARALNAQAVVQGYISQVVRLGPGQHLKFEPLGR
jgi:hypothetical protein